MDVENLTLGEKVLVNVASLSKLDENIILDVDTIVLPHDLTNEGLKDTLDIVALANDTNLSSVVLRVTPTVDVISQPR